MDSFLLDERHIDERQQPSHTLEWQPEVTAFDGLEDLIPHRCNTA